MAGTSEEIAKLAIPLLFGTLFNWMLFGVLLVQTYVYSYNFPNDRLWIKLMVYFIFALETAQTALTGADVYYWFINGFGDFEQLGDSHFAAVDISIMIGVSSVVVQMYFCYRIWTLTRYVWLCMVIAFISLVSVAGGIWGGSASLIGGKFAVPEIARISLYLWSTSALADIMIAIAMTLLLSRASEGYCRFVLIRVVRLTIETNALTASLVIATFVLFVAFPTETYCTLPAAIIGKLYSNTLLLSLNNRVYFRDRSRSSVDGDTEHFRATSRVFTMMTSNDFSGAETQLRSQYSHARDPEDREGDSTVINSDPSHSPGDTIHTKKSPSIAQSSAHGGE